MAGKNKIVKNYNRILFQTDFSAISENAAGLYVPHLSFEKIDEELRTVAEDMLERFVARAFKGYMNIDTRVLLGEPYKEIIKLVSGSRIDIVVMGTAGRSGIDRFIFVSACERILRKVDCQVLIIPPSKSA